MLNVMNAGTLVSRDCSNYQHIYPSQSIRAATYSACDVVPSSLVPNSTSPRTHLQDSVQSSQFEEMDVKSKWLTTTSMLVTNGAQQAMIPLRLSNRKMTANSININLEKRSLNKFIQCLRPRRYSRQEKIVKSLSKEQVAKWISSLSRGRPSSHPDNLCCVMQRIRKSKTNAQRQMVLRRSTRGGRTIQPPLSPQKLWLLAVSGSEGVNVKREILNWMGELTQKN